jgi:hypothetical protein
MQRKIPKNIQNPKLIVSSKNVCKYENMNFTLGNKLLFTIE